MFAGASLDENSGAFCELKANFFRLILTKAEFCGLTLKDVDLENRTVNIDHQLQRTSDMRYIIETQRRMPEQEYCQSQRMWHRCFR